jgi:glutathione S-transferase
VYGWRVADLTLYQLPTRPWGSPNMSPFCMKLECYLRMAEVPYEIARMQIGKAPKGKIPYIVRADGTRMGDSQLIIKALERERAAAGKPTLDAELSARDAALGHLVRRALDEAFYFAAVYVRWETPDGYAAVREEMTKFLPRIAMPIVHRSIRKKLHAQQHGDRPRTVDCTVFAFLEAMLGFPVESALKARLAAHANLVAYRERIRARWWSDVVG